MTTFLLEKLHLHREVVCEAFWSIVADSFIVILESQILGLQNEIFYKIK